MPDKFDPAQGRDPHHRIEDWNSSFDRQLNDRRAMSGVSDSTGAVPLILLAARAFAGLVRVTWRLSKRAASRLRRAV